MNFLQNFTSMIRTAARPVGALVNLGPTHLAGALDGVLCLEVMQGEPNRLWAMYANDQKLEPYSRLCSPTPQGAPEVSGNLFWLNPDDQLVHTIGHGCEWFIDAGLPMWHGLYRGRVNPLMLPADLLQMLDSEPSQAWEQEAADHHHSDTFQSSFR